MYLWRRNRPRVVYEPVAIIHGVAYLVKDEIVFKHRYAEWVLPGSMQKHIPYNRRQLPVVISPDTQHEKPLWLSSVPSASGQALLSSLLRWYSG